jgi:lysophospholipase L1-like esterase
MAPIVRTTITNIGILVAALLVSCLIGESFVRLLYKDKSVLFPRYHTDYRYGQYTIRGIRPSEEYWMTSADGRWKFVTNSRGFRNTREFNYEKPANVLRVLSIGDSHTQGYEVRQDFTFSAVLERYLRRELNERAEVINAGVSGFSTAEELVFLENEGVKYRPDVVLLGFFANDFEDNLKSGLFELDAQGKLVARKSEHLPGVAIQNAIYSVPGTRWLSENSYFYSLLFNRVWDYFKARLAAKASTDAARTTNRPVQEAADFEYAIATSSTVSADQIALAAALIERAQQFCNSHGIRLIVIDIPARTSLYRSGTSLPSALIERLRSAGIEVVSSLDLLRDFEGVAELHAPNGHHHISELTHSLIAIEVGRRLAHAPH